MAGQPKSPRSEPFRHGHEELSALMQSLSQQLVLSDLQRDASSVRSSLSMLGGKLTIHLAMEDDALYPRLATHKNLSVRQVSEQLRAEMGGLFGAFKQYARRWPTAEAIQLNAADFIQETQSIFAALRARIAKEESHIFPRLDDV